MTDEQIMAKLSQIIRVGFVNARMPEKMRVKVTIPDTVGKPLITDFLPVLCPRACEDMQYDLPDIGDQVLVLFLAYGLEQGFVVGAMYGKQVPPVQSGDKWHRKFKDGTYLEYDREEHKLTASVQGDVEITATGNIRAELEGELSASSQGPASIKSASGISMDSPSMSIGGSGGTAADMQGDFRLRQGDVTAEGISLRNHTHTCPACGAQTSPPVGGGGSGGSGGEGSGSGSGETGNGDKDGNTETGGETGNGNGKLPTAIVPGIINEYAAHIPGAIAVGPDFRPDEEMEKALRNMQGKLETDVDKLIFCLPDIAEHMAGEISDEADKEGWLLLNALFHIWLSGKANSDAFTNPDPVFVSWDWLMQYRRAGNAYARITDPETLFSAKAKGLLAERLQGSGKFTTQKETFDYITPGADGYASWFASYFQSVEVPRERFPFFTPDGLMAAMGSFRLRALAKGYVEPVPNGHKIVVEQVAIVATDSFNFDEDKESRGCEQGNGVARFLQPKYA